MDNISFNEKDLVCVRYLFNTDSGEVLSSNEDYGVREKYDFQTRSLIVWLRVVFIDNDNSFTGIVERHEKNRWSDADVKIVEIGEHVKISNSRVSKIASLDKEWCYSDNVTQCDCPGLCRNK